MLNHGVVRTREAGKTLSITAPFIGTWDEHHNSATKRGLVLSFGGIPRHVVASGAISDKDSASSRNVGCFAIVPTIPSLASGELLTHGELLTQDRNKKLVVFASFGYIYITFKWIQIEKVMNGIT